MQNEFTNNRRFPCAAKNDGDYQSGCGINPLSQISPMGLWVSLICLFALYFVCYMISWWILKRLSSTYE